MKYIPLEKLHTPQPKMKRKEDKRIKDKEKEFKNILKLGRTHLQDATPIALSQEFSGYKELLIKSKKRLIESHKTLKRLAQGGTAVGTGINAPKNFDKEFCKILSNLTNFHECM